MFLATCTRAATCKPCRFQAYSCYSTYILAFRRGMNIYRGDTTERLKFLRRKTVTRHLVEKPIKLCGGTPPPPPPSTRRALDFELSCAYKPVLCKHRVRGYDVTRGEFLEALSSRCFFLFRREARVFEEEDTCSLGKKARDSLYKTRE